MQTLVEPKNKNSYASSILAILDGVTETETATLNADIINAIIYICFFFSPNNIMAAVSLACRLKYNLTDTGI